MVQRYKFTMILQKSCWKICRSEKILVPLHPLWSSSSTGEMVEWSITAVLKTAVLRGTGGSNPSLSANKGRQALLGVFFCCVCEPGSHVLSVASLCESVPLGRARIPLSPPFNEKGNLADSLFCAWKSTICIFNPLKICYIEGVTPKKWRKQSRDIFRNYKHGMYYQMYYRPPRGQ